VVARDLLEEVAKEVEWANYEVVRNFKGAELEHILTQHPLYDRTSLMMLGEHVTTDSGTGFVHTAPGHG